MEAGAGLQGAQARPGVVIRRLQCLGWVQPWEFAGPAISWLPGLLLLPQTGMLYQCPLWVGCGQSAVFTAGCSHLRLCLYLSKGTEELSVHSADITEPLLWARHLYVVVDCPFSVPYSISLSGGTCRWTFELFPGFGYLNSECCCECPRSSLREHVTVSLGMALLGQRLSFSRCCRTVFPSDCANFYSTSSVQLFCVLAQKHDCVGFGFVALLLVSPGGFHLNFPAD